TVLPALMIAPEPSCVIIEGGTHNPFAPPFDFLEAAFVPLVNRMGPRIAVVLERPGFYPEGGGRICATIEPSQTLSALDLTERGALVRRSARALVSHLPKSIADRELRVVRKLLQVRRDACEAVELTDAAGPGNVLFITIEHQRVTEVFTGFGQRGLPAEAVANRAARAAKEYLSSGAAVGPNLADQLLIPLALAGVGQFTTLAPSEHMTTNIAVIKKFLDVPMDLRQIDAAQWQLCVSEPAA
ncbi:MAG: RNA 3'-terminal phosphate cyclase, partial [Planctomycetes bacterium]|nr:RNA 3'-terminal phosphate cyclase [Planctomycetota bacterium]